MNNINELLSEILKQHLCISIGFKKLVNFADVAREDITCILNSLNTLLQYANYNTQNISDIKTLLNTLPTQQQIASTVKEVVKEAICKHLGTELKKLENKIDGQFGEVNTKLDSIENNLNNKNNVVEIKNIVNDLKQYIEKTPNEKKDLSLFAKLFDDLKQIVKQLEQYFQTQPAVANNQQDTIKNLSNQVKKLVEKVNNLSKLIEGKSNLQGVNNSAQDFTSGADISTQPIKPQNQVLFR